MDRNTVIGLVLIGILLIGFSYFSQPNQEQVAAWQHYNDSVAVAQRQQEALQAKAAAALANEKEESKLDSASVFYNSRKGEEGIVTIENELMKISLNNKGGGVRSVMLKEYNNREKEPLVLFDGNDASVNFCFYNKDGVIQSQDYFFTPVNKTATSVTMRLASDEKSYIDLTYTLNPNNYLVDFTIQTTGMGDKLLKDTKYIDIAWKQKARQQERGSTYENRLATLTYKTNNDDTDHLSESKDVEERLPAETKLDWIAYKNQFFSSVLISEQTFEEVVLNSKMEQPGSGYIKSYASEARTGFDPTGEAPTKMHFYFGPNHYKTLKALDKGRTYKWELDDLVYLGWPVVRQINKWFTVNIFDWLSSWGMSMGVVLLIMTIIVKIVIFPATWKTYMSSARMRVLKPEIDKINQKYPKQEDAMKKQQEVMELYRQYGVSPMGGCLPMLLQFPILMALFMFVPSAIELRGESFLWASDLSTYDDIIKFPFHIPFLGSHLSLFCLLMTATTIINTKFTMQQQDTGQQQMAGMKWMMYLMPVMFLFILNDFPAGLNYYYFISTLIGILTMIVLRKATNEEKILAELEANKAKTKTKKKSGFSARLEAMQKEQQRLADERAKRK